MTADLSAPAVVLQVSDAATPVAPKSTETTQRAQAEPVDECITCHSDKEMLIEVAEPEAETEAESSGTG